MAGLVTRFVWIWPTWDDDRTSKAARYQLQTVELGWFSVDEASGGGGTPTRVEFCRCEVVAAADRVGGTTTARRRCVYNNDTTDQETTMSPERCHVTTSYTSESVSADHAVRKMIASPSWIAQDLSLIHI